MGDTDKFVCLCLLLGSETRRFHKCALLESLKRRIILSSLRIDVFCMGKQVCSCHPSGAYKKRCKAFRPQIRYNKFRIQGINIGGWFYLRPLRFAC